MNTSPKDWDILGNPSPNRSDYLATMDISGNNSNMLSPIVNATERPLEYCEPLDYVPLIITAGLVSGGIIIGNALVIQSIVFGSARFFRPMYWFIIHLSVSDFCIGVMLLWNYCLAALFNIHNTLDTLSFVNGVWVTSACASVFGILLLAIDRYMQVVHRRQHRLYVNQYTVAVAITFAWVFPTSVFLIAPMVSDWSCKNNCECQVDQYIHCHPVVSCSQVIPPFTKSYILIVIIYIFLVMPLPILIYGLIFIRARRSHKLATRQRMRHRDIRLIRTLVVIMLIFVLSLLPCGIIMCIVSTNHTQKIDYCVLVLSL
uniref:Cannabinoid receptor 1-like n=1 Tax=Phallusia mammillata TaxID=59560 RepID=A0A6F9DAA2_9ASCI|nr:cannabinoid receptor 1-like [Phallusia mammillata]